MHQSTRSWWILSDALLEVDNLRTHYFTRQGTTNAVDNVSFRLLQGQTLGITGESGCGKSTLAHSIIRLLPPSAKVVSGTISYKGLDLVKASELDLRKIRWRRTTALRA